MSFAFKPAALVPSAAACCVCSKLASAVVKPSIALEDKAPKNEELKAATSALGSCASSALVKPSAALLLKADAADVVNVLNQVALEFNEANCVEVKYAACPDPYELAAIADKSVGVR